MYIKKFLVKAWIIGFVFVLLFASLMFVFCPASIASDTIYVWSTETKPLNDTTQTSSNIVTNDSQSNNSNTEIASSSGTSKLNLDCGSAVLIEQHSGQVLYEQNMHEKLRPASVTKVMTILLIMEAIDSGRLSYSDKIPCTENAAGMGGSQIWLDVREELTVDEMLKAICIVSANEYSVQKRQEIFYTFLLIFEHFFIFFCI